MTYGLWSLGLSYAIESHPLMDAILFPYVSKDQNSLSNHLLRFRNLVTNNVCTLCKVCTSRQLMFDQHHSNLSISTQSFHHFFIPDRLGCWATARFFNLPGTSISLSTKLEGSKKVHFIFFSTFQFHHPLRNHKKSFLLQNIIIFGPAL